MLHLLTAVGWTNVEYYRPCNVFPIMDLAGPSGCKALPRCEERITQSLPPSGALCHPPRCGPEGAPYKYGNPGVLVLMIWRTVPHPLGSHSLCSGLMAWVHRHKWHWSRVRPSASVTHQPKTATHKTCFL